MPIYIVSIVIQVAFVVHILKTGRNTTWIWIVVLIPVAGSIAYFIVELLPGLMDSRSGRKIQRNIGEAINPNKNMNEAQFNYTVSDSIENSIQLANECLNKGMFEDAKQLCVKCLRGVHEHDPYVMHCLARAEFGLRNFSEVKSVLEMLIAHNPEFKNADAHLLYARSLEELNEQKAALHEYEALEGYYPGPEATYRYGKLLKSVGENDKANEMFEKIIHRSKISGRHYNSLHKEWIALAQKENSGWN